VFAALRLYTIVILREPQDDPELVEWVMPAHPPQGFGRTRQSFVARAGIQVVLRPFGSAQGRGEQGRTTRELDSAFTGMTAGDGCSRLQADSA
jgi:hypothetical protein